MVDQVEDRRVSLAGGPSLRESSLV